MIAALIRAMRPHQWVKNLLVFVSLVFAHKLTDLESVKLSLMAFAILCLLSSSIYLLNDVVDREADRAHPRKKSRPIASGALPVRVALTSAFVFSVLALLWSLTISVGAEGGLPAGRNIPFYAVPLAYVVLQVAYTFVLKRMLIVDCICIALGFLLRVHAGSLAIGEPSSDWVLLCTFFFSLFLAFSKRRDEVVKVSEAAVPAVAASSSALPAASGTRAGAK